MSAAFELPAWRSAAEPPEERGLARDGVRLLVAEPHALTHTRFAHLAEYLSPGDAIVVNTSATVDGALDGTRPDGRTVAVHVSAPVAPETYVVELRTADGRTRILDAHQGERIEIRDGSITLTSAYQNPLLRKGSRLWHARFDVRDGVDSYLARAGRPIAYGYTEHQRPLSIYQTVFGRDPGSAEMPSAARPFSERVVLDLITRGIEVIPVLLHTGLSSLEAGETPLPEWYAIEEPAARRINETRSAGGRVVAVGTTATRAVETATSLNGEVRGSHGWTDLVLGPHRPARVVDGLVTGWHEPQASHLLLLRAVAGTGLVERAYDAALDADYLWHEFGDSALFLP